MRKALYCGVGFATPRCSNDIFHCAALLAPALLQAQGAIDLFVPARIVTRTMGEAQ